MELKAETPADPTLLNLLAGHPHVDIEPTSPKPILNFSQEGRPRSVHLGDPRVEIRGLVELMDNNPMVCADIVSVPSPLATLGLIALGPLFQAGLVVEPPVVQTNAPGEGVGFWETTGWNDAVHMAVEDMDLGRVYALTAIAVTLIRTQEEADTLFDECFGRSFYVRAAPDGPWDTALVSGTPMALYRIKLTPNFPHSLMTVQVMADKEGKCGAAQQVHAMNVMAGFEESLGIPDSL